MGYRSPPSPCLSPFLSPAGKAGNLQKVSLNIMKLNLYRLPFMSETGIVLIRQIRQGLLFVFVLVFLFLLLAGNLSTRIQVKNCDLGRSSRAIAPTLSSTDGLRTNPQWWPQYPISLVIKAHHPGTNCVVSLSFSQDVVFQFCPCLCLYLFSLCLSPFPVSVLATKQLGMLGSPPHSHHNHVAQAHKGYLPFPCLFVLCPCPQFHVLWHPQTPLGTIAVANSHNRNH